MVQVEDVAVLRKVEWLASITIDVPVREEAAATLVLRAHRLASLPTDGEQESPEWCRLRVWAPMAGARWGFHTQVLRRVWEPLAMAGIAMRWSALGHTRASVWWHGPRGQMWWLYRRTTLSRWIARQAGLPAWIRTWAHTSLGWVKTGTWVGQRGAVEGELTAVADFYDRPASDFTARPYFVESPEDPEVDTLPGPARPWWYWCVFAGALAVGPAYWALRQGWAGYLLLAVAAVAALCLVIWRPGAIGIKQALSLGPLPWAGAGGVAYGLSHAEVPPAWFLALLGLVVFTYKGMKWWLALTETVPVTNILVSAAFGALPLAALLGFASHRWYLDAAGRSRWPVTVDPLDYLWAGLFTSVIIAMALAAGLAAWAGARYFHLTGPARWSILPLVAFYVCLSCLLAVVKLQTHAHTAGAALARGHLHQGQLPHWYGYRIDTACLPTPVPGYPLSATRPVWVLGQDGEKSYLTDPKSPIRRWELPRDRDLIGVPPATRTCIR